MDSNTVVSRIYTPRFATLALAENVGGDYMRDQGYLITLRNQVSLAGSDILSRKYAPTSGATPRCSNIILQTDPEAGSTRSYTGLSRPPETRIPFGQDRLREVGHSVDSGVFQALPGFIRSIVL